LSQFFRFYREHGWGALTLYLIQQIIISQFDIQSTLFGLQHDFCVLWKEITVEARNSGSHIPSHFLRPIRHICIALHQGTNAAPTAFSASTCDYDPILELPSSYSLCNIPVHHRHMRQVDLGATGETTHPPLLPNAIPTIIPSFAVPDVTSFPTLNPDHSNMHPAGEP
jgi:hypothetical protein